MERELLLAEVHENLAEHRLLAIRQLLAEEQACDIAELFPDLADEERLLVYRLLPKDVAAEVLVDMLAEDRRALIEAFSDYELRRVLDELYSDDTVELLDEMPSNFVRRILKNCTPEMRRSVNELLKYPENSAGSMMTT